MERNVGIALLKVFKEHGISHDPKHGLQKVLDFQDFIGRSTVTELQEFEASLTVDERKTFFWALCTCCDFDTFTFVLNNTLIQRKCSDWIEKEERRLQMEIGKREYALRKKESTFQECKKAIYKRIAGLRNVLQSIKKHNTFLDRELSESFAETRKLRQQNHVLRQEVKEFHALKDLLQGILT